MKKAYLYIGSNNQTHQLETGKIKQIVSNSFDGFTLGEVIGFWKGSEEKSLKIEIVIEDKQELQIIGLAKTLKKKLDQDSVLVEFIQSNIAFI